MVRASDCTLEQLPEGISARAARAYMLGVLLFPARRSAETAARAALMVLGRGRNPLPSVGLLLAVPVQSLQCRADTDDKPTFSARLYRPSESALAQPLSSFSYFALVVSLPL